MNFISQMMPELLWSRDVSSWRTAVFFVLINYVNLTDEPVCVCDCTVHVCACTVRVCVSVLYVCGSSRVTADVQFLHSPQMEMRAQDQALIRQLMDLHNGIQELKLELSEEEEEPEGEEEEPEEEVCWDSGSEAGASSYYTSSGEVSFSSCLSTRMTPPPVDRKSVV